MSLTSLLPTPNKISPPWLPNCLLTLAGGNTPFECVYVSGPKPGTFSPLSQQILRFLYEVQHLEGPRSPPHLSLRGGSQKSLCILWPCSLGHHCLLGSCGKWAKLGQSHSLSCESGLKQRDTDQHLLSLRGWRGDHFNCVPREAHLERGREEGMARERHTEYELGHEMSRDLWPRVMARASTVPDDILVSSSKSPWGFVLFPALGYHNPPSNLITPFCFFFWFTVISLLLVTSKRVLIRPLDFRTPFYRDSN